MLCRRNDYVNCNPKCVANDCGSPFVEKGKHKGYRWKDYADLYDRTLQIETKRLVANVWEIVNH